jgi:hypothetical protein
MKNKAIKIFGIGAIILITGMTFVPLTSAMCQPDPVDPSDPVIPTSQPATTQPATTQPVDDTPAWWQYLLIWLGQNYAKGYE